MTSSLPDGAPPALSANYQLTLDDLKAARKLHASRKPWTRVLLVISLLLLGVSSGLSFADSGQLPLDILSYVIPLGFVLVFVWLVRFMATRNAAELPMFRAPSITEVSDEGVSTAYSVTRYFWGWPDVTGVKRGPTHLLLYASKTTFVIVPRRAFESDADYDRFAEFALSRWQGAQPTVPPIAAI